MSKKAPQVRLSTLSAVELDKAVEEFKQKGLKFSVTLLVNQSFIKGLPLVKKAWLK